MAPRAQNLHQLHASWDGTGLALWAFDGTETYESFRLRQLASVAFGYGGVALLGPAVTPVRIPTLERTVYAATLRPFEENAYSFVAERHAVASTSPSLRWLYAAADLAERLVQQGWFSPAINQVGGRWDATWKLRHGRSVSAAVAELAASAPPVVWAPFADGEPPHGTRQVVEYFVDGAARWALDANGSRPDLGRSNRPEQVVTRRVAAALRGHRGVPVVNADQDRVVAAMGQALSEHSASVDAGVAFRSRARLAIPTYDDPSTVPGAAPESDEALLGNAAPWWVSFEVVLVDDPTVTFGWSAVLAEALEVVLAVGADAAAVMADRVRGLAADLADDIDEFRHLDPEIGLVMLDITQVASLLGKVERCSALGCALLVPKDLAVRTVRVAGQATPAPGGGVSANMGEAMVDIDWTVVLGDDRLTDEEILELADAKSELVQLRGSWVRVEKAHVTSALENLEQRRRIGPLSPADLLRLAATSEGDAIELADATDEGDPEQSADGWLGQLLDGLPDERLTEADEPEGFVGTLRPYQRRAVGWLDFLHRLGLGGCLADDMGLGKTPTTLAHLLAHTSDQPSLVMCPLSVVHNWEAEAAFFTPGLRVVVAHGATRKRGSAFARQLEQADIVISTYGTVTRDIEGMAEHRWNIVVCDEAQAIKNHRTKAARAVRALDARQFIALTGTPVENRLTELWSILDAANPGSLGGVTWFRDTFATPIETKGDEQALDGMRRLTAPFVLRRTKADKSLVPDLPDKVEQVAWATLTDEQAGLYQAVLDDFVSASGQSTVEEGGMARRGLVLATLTRLKQICNHPAQFLAAGGEEPGKLAGRSGKLERFDELVAELLDAGERALIFTQYREMGELLVRRLLEGHDVSAKFLHGGVSRKRRDAMVTKFQSGEGAPLQVVSLKAGGTGLNLTAASRVIHYDRWWNPAVEDQATDRAWRIGQTSTVFVHKLVCQGTLEERIDQLLRDKKALADSAVSSGEGWLTEMSTDELRGLFALDRRDLDDRP